MSSCWCCGYRMVWMTSIQRKVWIGDFSQAALIVATPKNWQLRYCTWFVGIGSAWELWKSLALLDLAVPCSSIARKSWGVATSFGTDLSENTRAAAATGRTTFQLSKYVEMQTLPLALATTVTEGGRVCGKPNWSQREAWHRQIHRNPSTCRSLNQWNGGTSIWRFKSIQYGNAMRTHKAGSHPIGSNRWHPNSEEWTWRPESLDFCPDSQRPHCCRWTVSYRPLEFYGIQGLRTEANWNQIEIHRNLFHVPSHLKQHEATIVS